MRVPSEPVADSPAMAPQAASLARGSRAASSMSHPWRIHPPWSPGQIHLRGVPGFFCLSMASFRGGSGLGPELARGAWACRISELTRRPSRIHSQTFADSPASVKWLEAAKSTYSLNYLDNSNVEP